MCLYIHIYWCENSQMSGQQHDVLPWDNLNHIHWLSFSTLYTINLSVDTLQVYASASRFYFYMLCDFLGPIWPHKMPDLTASFFRLHVYWKINSNQREKGHD